MADANVDIVINAKTGKAKKKLASFEKRVGSFAKNVGGIFAGAFAAQKIASFVSSATKEFRRFEKEVKNVTTLTNDISFKRIQNEILGLNKVLGSSEELTRGLYQALSAGVKAGKGVEFVGKAAKFAKAGLIKVDTAVDALTTAMNAYGLSVKDVDKISDIFFGTIKEGKINGEELARAMGRILGVSSTMGVGINEVGAALATMTKVTGNADLSTTSLIALFNSFIKPTNEMAQALQEAGYASGEMLLKSEGLEGGLAFLTEAAGGSSSTMARLVGSIEAVKGTSVLAGDNIGKFSEAMEKLKNSTGDTNEAFDKQIDNIDKLEGSWRAIKEIVGEVGRSVLEGVATEETTKGLNKIAETIRKRRTLYNIKIAIDDGDNKKLRETASTIDIVNEALKDLHGKKYIEPLRELRKELRLAEDAIKEFGTDVEVTEVLDPGIQKAKDEEDRRIKEAGKNTELINELELVELRQQRLEILNNIKSLESELGTLKKEGNEADKSRIEDLKARILEAGTRLAETEAKIAAGGSDALELQRAEKAKEELDYTQGIAEARRLAADASFTMLDTAGRISARYNEQIAAIEKMIALAIKREGAESQIVKTLKDQRATVISAREAALAKEAERRTPKRIRRSRRAPRSVAPQRAITRTVVETTIAERHLNNEKLRGLNIELKKARELAKDDGELKKNKERLEALKKRREFLLQGEGYKPKQFLKYADEEIKRLEGQIKPVEEAKKAVKDYETQIQELRDANARLQEQDARNREQAQREAAPTAIPTATETETFDESDDLIELKQAAEHAFGKISSGLKKVRTEIKAFIPKKIKLSINDIEFLDKLAPMNIEYAKLRNKNVLVDIIGIEAFTQKVNFILEELNRIPNEAKTTFTLEVKEKGLKGVIEAFKELEEYVDEVLQDIKDINNEKRSASSSSSSSSSKTKVTKEGKVVPVNEGKRKRRSIIEETEGLHRGGIVPAQGRNGGLYRLGDGVAEAVIPLDRYEKLLLKNKTEESTKAVNNFYTFNLPEGAYIGDITDIVTKLDKQRKILVHRGDLANE